MIKGFQVTRKHQNTSTGLSLLLLLHHKLQSCSVKLTSMCYLNVLDDKMLLWVSESNTKMLAGLDSFLNIAQNSQFSSSTDTIAPATQMTLQSPEPRVSFPISFLLPFEYLCILLNVLGWLLITVVNFTFIISFDYQNFFYLKY